MYNCIIFTDVTDSITVTKSIGAYKCAHQLRANGYTCLVVDHTHTFTIEEMRTLITASVTADTKLVGFSDTFMMTSDVPKTDTGYKYLPLPESQFMPQGQEFARQVISELKQASPDVKIVVGGAKTHPNYNNKLVDFVNLGFSEASVVDVADHVFKNLPLPNSYKNIWGCTIVDDKTASTYNFKDHTFQWQATDVVNMRVLPLEVSRGCIFKCKFCSYPLLGKKNNDYIRDVDRIRDELQRNYDLYGVEYYYIIDDTFNDNKIKLAGMLEAVQQLTFKPKFWAYNRLDLIARDLASSDLLYDIGVRGFYFGIETLYMPAGKVIGKGYDRQKMIDAISYMRNKYPDITMHGSFIVGLPGESIESSTDTFNKILSQDIPLHSVNFKGLQIFDLAKVSWSSEFSRDFAQYGYTQIPEVTTMPRANINWTSEITDRDSASATAKQFNAEWDASQRAYLPGSTVWPLINYDLDYNTLTATLVKDVDWPALEVKKDEFVAEYKRRLFDLLSK